MERDENVQRSLVVSVSFLSFDYTAHLFPLQQASSSIPRRSLIPQGAGELFVPGSSQVPQAAAARSPEILPRMETPKGTEPFAYPLTYTHVRLPGMLGLKKTDDVGLLPRFRASHPPLELGELIHIDKAAAPDEYDPNDDNDPEEDGDDANVGDEELIRRRLAVKRKLSSDPVQNQARLYRARSASSIAVSEPATAEDQEIIDDPEADEGEGSDNEDDSDEESEGPGRGDEDVHMAGVDQDAGGDVAMEDVERKPGGVAPGDEPDLFEGMYEPDPNEYADVLGPTQPGTSNDADAGRGEPIVQDEPPAPSVVEADVDMQAEPAPAPASAPPPAPKGKRKLQRMGVGKFTEAARAPYEVPEPPDDAVLNLLDVETPLQFEGFRETLEYALGQEVEKENVRGRLLNVIDQLSKLSGIVPGELSGDREVTNEEAVALASKAATLKVRVLGDVTTRYLRSHIQLGNIFTSNIGSKLVTSVVHETVFRAFKAAIIGYAHWDWHERFAQLKEGEPAFPDHPARLALDLATLTARVKALLEVMLVRGIDAPGNPMLLGFRVKKFGASSKHEDEKRDIIQELRDEGYITYSPHGESTIWPPHFDEGLVECSFLQGRIRSEGSRAMWQEYSPFMHAFEDMSLLVKQRSSAWAAVRKQVAGLDTVLEITRFWPALLISLGKYGFVFSIGCYELNSDSRCSRGQRQPPHNGHQQLPNVRQRHQLWRTRGHASQRHRRGRRRGRPAQPYRGGGNLEGPERTPTPSQGHARRASRIRPPSEGNARPGVEETSGVLCECLYAPVSGLYS